MKTILIIEDDADTLGNLALTLQMEGYRALTAANGQAGLELARRDPPDLVLCDLMMPGLDGYAVLTALRADPLTRNLPFIFLTARSGRLDLRAGMNLGADDYLTKPADGAEVLAAIEARFARHQALAQPAAPASGFHPDYSSAQPLEAPLGLTPREAEVLLWLAQGKSNPEIATILGNAENTVKIHITRLFEKLGVDNRHAAGLRALEILSNPR